MKPTFKLLMIVFLGSAFLTSCVSSKKYNELLAERDQLSTNLTKTQETVQMLEGEKSQLEIDKTSLMGEIDNIKGDLSSLKTEMSSVKKMMSEKEAQLNKINTEINTAFADVNTPGMNVRQDGEMFYVSMQEKLLFRSGSSYLNKSGRDILSSFAEMLNNNAGLNVIVEGHTDDQAMKPGAAHVDNWGLSMARAATVTRYLIKKGVAPSRLIASGRGEFAPAVIADPQTAETREQNRRVEFAIMPEVSGLYNMIKG